MEEYMPNHCLSSPKYINLPDTNAYYKITVIKSCAIHIGIDTSVEQNNEPTKRSENICTISM